MTHESDRAAIDARFRELLHRFGWEIAAYGRVLMPGEEPPERKPMRGLGYLLVTHEGPAPTR